MRDRRWLMRDEETVMVDRRDEIDRFEGRLLMRRLDEIGRRTIADKKRVMVDRRDGKMSRNS